MKGSRSRRYAAYRREVARLTAEHHPPRPGVTRQHHIPIARAFAWGLPASLVGSAENVDYWPLSANLSQGTRLDTRAEEILRKHGYEHRIKETQP
jgi:hypothetical protein